MDDVHSRAGLVQPPPPSHDLGSIDVQKRPSVAPDAIFSPTSAHDERSLPYTAADTGTNGVTEPPHGHGFDARGRDGVATSTPRHAMSVREESSAPVDVRVRQLEKIIEALTEKIDKLAGQGPSPNGHGLERAATDLHLDPPKGSKEEKRNTLPDMDKEGSPGADVKGSPDLKDPFSDPYPYEPYGRDRYGSSKYRDPLSLSKDPWDYPPPRDYSKDPLPDPYAPLPPLPPLPPIDAEHLPTDLKLKHEPFRCTTSWFYEKKAFPPGMEDHGIAIIGGSPPSSESAVVTGPASLFPDGYELPNLIVLNVRCTQRELAKIFSLSSKARCAQFEAPFKLLTAKLPELEKGIENLDEEIIKLKEKMAKEKEKREKKPAVSKLGEVEGIDALATGEKGDEAENDGNEAKKGNGGKAEDVKPTDEVSKEEESIPHIGNETTVSKEGDGGSIDPKQVNGEAGQDEPLTDTEIGDPFALDPFSFGEVAVDPQELQQKELSQLHLRVLVGVIKKELGPLLKLRERIKNREITEIDFANIWHLFEPGTSVFKDARKGSETIPSAWHVHMVTGARPLSAPERKEYGKDTSELRTHHPNVDQPLPLVLQCHQTWFDGTYFGPKSRQFKIEAFEGMKPITDLDVYPAEFHAQYNTLWSLLQARGARFKDLTGVSCKIYDGLTVDADPEQIQGEVQIDWKTGQELEARFNKMIEEFGKLAEIPITPGLGDTFCTLPNCTICIPTDIDRDLELARFKEWEKVNMASKRLINVEKETLPERMYPFLGGAIVAYYFKGRSWHLLAPEIVQDKEVEEEMQGFKELVVDPEHKDLLKALIAKHKAGEQPGGRRDPAAHMGPAMHMDLVRGKGRGLIILLHGSPGVGKTLTAETIATYTGRPLYPITCGDLGEEAKTIERELRHHFKLAHKWGCVLLLDEADVFLAKRERNDVTRNGLVSVFLRELEYYSGILFLTTNQVGVLDEAFKSRIHISLYYPDLDKEKFVTLWENNLKRLKDPRNRRPGTRRIDFDQRDIIDFAKSLFDQCGSSPWNGRQVRNAFQTAIALAEWDALTHPEEGDDPNVVKLRVQHFRQVSEVAQHFERYLMKVHDGRGAEQLAWSDRRRAPGLDDARNRPMNPRNAASRDRAADARNRRGGSGAPRSRGSPTAIRGMNPYETPSQDQGLPFRPMQRQGRPGGQQPPPRPQRPVRPGGGGQGAMLSPPQYYDDNYDDNGSDGGAAGAGDDYRDDYRDDFRGDYRDEGRDFGHSDNDYQEAAR